MKENNYVYPPTSGVGKTTVAVKFIAAWHRKKKR